MSEDSPSTPPYALATDEAVSPFAHFTRRLGKVNLMDVIDLAIRAKRLATPPWSAILGSAGFTSVGAGLGALIAGAALTSAGVLSSLLAGGALLLGAALVRTQRIESTGYYCADFMRFIDRWPPIEGEVSNSAYVEREAALKEPAWLVMRARSLRRQLSLRSG
jgi:hypothetical protein